jgi:hypothetical protein
MAPAEGCAVLEETTASTADRSGHQRTAVDIGNASYQVV